MVPLGPLVNSSVMYHGPRDTSMLGSCVVGITLGEKMMILMMMVTRQSTTHLALVLSTNSSASSDAVACNSQPMYAQSSYYISGEYSPYSILCLFLFLACQKGTLSIWPRIRSHQLLPLSTHSLGPFIQILNMTDRSTKNKGKERSNSNYWDQESERLSRIFSQSLYSPLHVASTTNLCRCWPGGI